MKQIKECIPTGAKMNKDEVRRLIDLRTHLIGFYNALDSKHVQTAVVQQKKAAYELEIAIKKLDNVLKNHVNIEQEKVLWV